MAITKEEGAAKGVAVDSLEMKAALMDALRGLFVAVREASFTKPFDVTVNDEDGATLRTFTLTRSDRLVMGTTDDVNKLFVLPLTIYLVDADLNVAKVQIGADLMIHPIEFQNGGGRN
jgi:hypothetical protein